MYAHITKFIFHSLLALFLTGVGILPAFTAQAAGELDGQEGRIIALTNQIRSQNGLSPLIQDSRLMVSARNKAIDMATKGYFAHADAEGRRMAYWIKSTGYSYTLAGENLAKGYTSVDRMVNAWAASPTHFKNMVEPSFMHIGIGIAYGEYEGRPMYFVVQHFGAPKLAAQPVVTQPSQPVTETQEPAVVAAPVVTQLAQTVTNKVIPPIAQPEAPSFAPVAYAAEAGDTPFDSDNATGSELPIALMSLFALVAAAQIIETKQLFLG